MILHHSIGVLTSSRAHIDVCVRQLADQSVASRCRELAEMQWLIDDIRDHGEVSDEAAVRGREIPDFSENC